MFDLFIVETSFNCNCGYIFRVLFKILDEVNIIFCKLNLDLVCLRIFTVSILRFTFDL